MSDSLPLCEEALKSAATEVRSCHTCSDCPDDWSRAEDEPGDPASPGATTADEEGSWIEDDLSEAEPIGLKDVLDGAYEAVERIGDGGFGEVYLVRDVDNVEYAAKFAEETHNLVWEAEMLDRVKDVEGFPRMHYCGTKGSNAVLVMDLLGRNLSELRDLCGGQLTLKTVLMVADQVLHRIEGLHTRGIVHGDIKPDNFMIGRGAEAGMIHAIDLGLANEYCDKVTGNHIPFCEDVEFTGTVAYASARAHQGLEQSRRDDLEAVGYMLIGLLQGELPWERSCSSHSNEEWWDHCTKQKSLMPIASICKDCPREFQKYLEYCRQCEFEEEPDYQYLRGLFEEVLRREELVNDGLFDWCRLRDSICSA